MAAPVLYMGDTSLAGAAGYLAGLMSHFDIGFDYLASDQAVSMDAVNASRKLFILSDYAARLMHKPIQQRVLEHVTHGAGLLMIGGWESFCGHGGDWANTILANGVPVVISETDDRVNCDQPALMIKTTDHPIAGTLPWSERPPTVGGFNRFKPRAGATTVLEVQRFVARHLGTDRFTFEPLADREPMLVVGELGKGRTAALATDLAPHWVGGFVDWGSSRVTATATGSWQIEVGSDYAQFVRNLITWTGALA